MAAIKAKKNLIFYGLLGMPLGGLLVATQVFVPDFYHTHYGVSLGIIGTIFLITRLIDVVTDPIAGWLIEQDILSRKSWLGLGIIFLALGAILLFLPLAATTLYIGFSMSLFYLGWTLTIIPYTAIGARISPDTDDKTSYNSAREFFGIVGTLLILLIIAMTEEPALYMVCFSLVILTVGGMIFLLKIKDPKVKSRKKTDQKTKTNYIGVIRNNAFRVLGFSYLLNGMANALPALLFLTFCREILELETTQAGQLLFLYLLCGCLSIPLWAYLSRNKWGKKKSWSVAMIIALSAFSLVGFCSPETIWLFYVITIITGLCFGADIALPPSMQADVVEKDYQKTGHDRSSLYFAAWAAITKISVGLSAGLFLPIIDWNPFDNQNLSIIFAYSIIPIACKLMAILILKKYHAP